jgi:predicted TIM-barrel fold metal-dependent hydrolase
MRVTDAQVHIWAAETPERPWPPGAGSFAHGPSFSADQLLARMDTAGVDRAVLVPPSFAGDRNEDCLAAARQHPERFRVMGRVDLTSPASRDWVPGWREQAGLLGVRLTFGRGASAGWLRDGTADWFWPAAAEAGMPVMVYAPGQLAEVAAIARTYPRLRISLCHLSLRPEQAGRAAVDRVIAALLPLAAHANITVKATGLPGNTSDQYPFAALHQQVRRVLGAFGPRRVFWGSDITRLNCGYREAVTMFSAELGFLGDDDLEWIMGRGLSEWAGWP